MSERLEFARALNAHDWYYAYSDDHRYWTRGSTERRNLTAMHKQLDCPFGMGELKAWAFNMIVEQFEEDADGNWYRQPKKYTSVAPTPRSELIIEARWNEIQDWLNE